MTPDSDSTMTSPRLFAHAMNRAERSGCSQYADTLLDPLSLMLETGVSGTQGSDHQPGRGPARFGSISGVGSRADTCRRVYVAVVESTGETPNIGSSARHHTLGSPLTLGRSSPVGAKSAFGRPVYRLEAAYGESTEIHTKGVRISEPTLHDSEMTLHNHVTDLSAPRGNRAAWSNAPYSHLESTMQ